MLYTQVPWNVYTYIYFGCETSCEQNFQKIWGLEAARKYKENETMLSLLAKTILKWCPVEVNLWKKILQILYKTKKCH